MEEKQWLNLDLEERILENIQHRYSQSIIHKKIVDSGRMELFAPELAKIMESPIYFFENYLYTDKNPLMFSDRIPNVVPFLLFDYQKDAIEEIWDCIVNGKRIYIEKSRQMGISWLMCGIFLYGFLFFDHKYLLLSQKEEYVDAKGDMRSLFEKMRFMMRSLPLWMIRDQMYKKGETALNSYMRISKKAGDGTGSITGESSNPNAGTGGTYNAIFMDEMAKMQNARAINTAVQSATGCIIYNSTPLGEFNEYARMRKIAYEGRISSLRLHWKLHPVYNQKGWYEWKTAGMDSAQIAQELEISFNASVEGAVYPNFHPMPVGVVEFGEFPYNPQYPLFISIDNSHGGKDPHAVTLAQITEMGKIRIIDSVQSEPYTSDTAWAKFMAKIPDGDMKITEDMMLFLNRYKKYKKGIFVADPYDTFATMNDTSIAKEYLKVGIILNTPTLKQNIQDRIGIVRNNLSRMEINNTNIQNGIINEDFIRAIQNSRYPERKENSQSTSKPSVPIPDDDCDHYRTSLEYLISYIVEQEEYGTIKSDGVQVAGFERKKRLIERADPLTGAITSEWK